jgi:hypothetical protein
LGLIFARIAEALNTKISSFKTPISTASPSQISQELSNMKRKNSTPANSASKKRAISNAEAEKNFRAGLFDSNVLADYTQQYAKSAP